MSDALVLLAILAAFYLHDCSLWVDRATVVFLTRGLRGWHPLQSRPLFTGGTKGLLPSFRLPPLTPVYLCPPVPTDSAPVLPLDRRLDLRTLRDDLTRFTGQALALRLLCNIFFLHLFAVVPGTMLLWSLEALWFPLLAILALLVFTIALEFRRLHARLWPDHAAARRSELIHMALYPPAALRAHDWLAHRVCSAYHPVAVAAVLCAPAVFAAFAARRLRYLRHPLPGETTHAESAAAEVDAVSHTVAAAGLDPETLLCPPPRVDATSLAYCPRCHTAYAISAGTCADCPAVALTPYVSDLQPGDVVPAHARTRA